MSHLVIEQSSPFCVLQDAGRFGVRHLGVTQGGAADWVSMGWANELLGNAPDAPVIEITLGGLSLRAHGDCLLALGGADLGAQVDGQPLKPWQSFLLRRDQCLTFTGQISGARAYLAAEEGFSAKPVLGSCSTVLRDCLGGLTGDGRALAVGDQLHCRPASPFQQQTLRTLGRGQIPDLSTDQPLDVIVGAQMADFAGQSLYDAFNTAWTLDTRTDRMGVRLVGPRLEYLGPGMISEGIPLGGIQVPPDGQPIVLGNDRQTIGGYPRLGAVTPLGMARLAQCLPGDEVRLRAVTQEVARRGYLRVMGQWQK